MRVWSLFGPRCVLAILAAASLPGGRCLRPADETQVGKAAGLDALSYARTFSEEGLFNTAANELWDDLQHKVVNASRSSILRAREYRALLENFSGEMAGFVQGQTELSNSVRVTQEQRMKDIQKILGGGMHEAGSGPFPGMNFGATDGSENGGPVKPAGTTSELFDRHNHHEKHHHSAGAEHHGASKGTLESQSTSSEPVGSVRDLQLGPRGTLQFVSTSSPELPDEAAGWDRFQDEMQGDLAKTSTTSLPEGAVEEDLDDWPQGAGMSESTSSPSTENPDEDFDDEVSGDVLSTSTTSPSAEYPDEDFDDEPSDAVGSESTSEPPSEENPDQDFEDEPSGATDESLPSTSTEAWEAATDDLEDEDGDAEDISEGAEETPEAWESETEDLDDTAEGANDGQPENTEVFAAVRCAFEPRSIQCVEEGARIQVLGAFWNRRVSKACGTPNRHASAMADLGAACTPNATAEVASECDGQENCLLPSDGGCPEDPFAAMRVLFKCI